MVFGSDADFAPSLALSSLDGTNGFRLDGIDADDTSGWSVASAGDVNGDGFDDLVIGAVYADPGGRRNASETYVLFGAATGLVFSAVTGTIGDDLLNGTPTSEQIDALAGNDWITPGAGAHTADGGAGSDRVSYSNLTTSLRIIQDEAGMRAFVGDGTDVLTNLERVTGTSQSDEFFFMDGPARSLGGQDMFHAAGDGTGTYDGGAGRDMLSDARADAGVKASLFRGKGWSGDAASDRYSGIRTEVEHLNDGVDGIDISGHAEILRFADGDFLL